MEIPEDKVIIVLILLADILNSIVREGIAVKHVDQRNAGIASMVTLTICLLFFLIASLIRVGILFCLDSLAKIFPALVQSLAAILYFYGDNINYIMQRYGDAIGCGDQCVTNNRIASVVALGVALLILQLVPSVLRKIADWTDDESVWYSTLDMIAVILKIDILYTAVVTMTKTDEFCGYIDETLSITFIIICTLVGIFAMVIHCRFSMKKVADQYKIVIVGSCVALAFSFILFLLADNEQPIDCAFDCDTFAANQTVNAITCNKRGNDGLRLGFMLVPFIMVFIIGSGLFFAICLDNNDERNKYQTV